MIVKLLTEHHLEFLNLKVGCRARPSLHMPKCHIVGNLMHWLNCNSVVFTKGAVQTLSRWDLTFYSFNCHL